MNTEKNNQESRYRKLVRMVARLKEILQCIICLELVGSPAVQCEAGHLMCGQCRDNLEENTCPTCRQPLIAVRNIAVEQVVEALPVECPNEDYGCQDLLEEDEMDAHRVTCPFRQFSCPLPPCPWAGSKPEIIGHMQDIHPQHVLSSNRQTVRVPVKWGEVSSWAMFLDDVILILKFSVDQATNFLLGSFECLGQLKPVVSITYHMTVKRGDRETTLSGSIAPERSDTGSQSLGEWNSVFPRSSYEDHPESEASTSSRYIKVDVAIEDNRIPVTLASVDVEVQTQGSDDVEGGVKDEASGDSTQQVGGGNQLDQTRDRVIHKLGFWLASGFCDIDNCPSFNSKIYHQMKETSNNIISCLVESIDDISHIINVFTCTRNFYIEMYLYRLSRDLAEINIKMEHARAAGGRYFRREWIFAYLLIVEQAVCLTFARYLDKAPAIDDLELLLTARERQMREECTLRMLRYTHESAGGGSGVKEMIGHVGEIYKKSREEISSLQSDAAAIPWS